MCLYSRPGVVGGVQSPWFILELQCYEPSSLAPSPLDRMDKVNSLPLFLSLSFSLFLSLSLFVSLRLACVCVSSVSGLWMRMLYSPWFSPCTAGLSPLTHPLILLSVSDKRPLKKYPPAFPCLPDLFKQATPSLCRLHFHLCSDRERQIYTQYIYCMDLHKTNKSGEFSVTGQKTNALFSSVS